MANTYPGAYTNKILACKLTCRALQLLTGKEKYKDTTHVYLAGHDASELKISREIEPNINLENLHAAEKEYDTYRHAFNHLPKDMQQCLWYGELEKMIRARQLDNIGVVWLDTCGTIENITDLADRIIPHVQDDAVFAFTGISGRDPYFSQRRHALFNDGAISVGGSKHAKASAMVLAESLENSGVGKFYFPFTISYRNIGTNACGEERLFGCRMFIAIGKIAKYKGLITESTYHLDMRADKNKWKFFETTSTPNAGALKAHLPKPFKDFFKPFKKRHYVQQLHKDNI